MDLECDPAASSSSSLSIHPLLFGERHSPSIRASVSGIEPGVISSLSLVLRSLCKGLVRNLSDMAPPEEMDAAGIDAVLATGACLERHPAMQRAVLEQFAGRNPKVPVLLLVICRILFSRSSLTLSDCSRGKFLRRRCSIRYGKRPFPEETVTAHESVKAQGLNNEEVYFANSSSKVSLALLWKTRRKLLDLIQQ